MNSSLEISVLLSTAAENIKIITLRIKYILIIHKLTCYKIHKMKNYLFSSWFVFNFDSDLEALFLNSHMQLVLVLAMNQWYTTPSSSSSMAANHKWLTGIISNWWCILGLFLLYNARIQHLKRFKWIWNKLWWWSIRVNVNGTIMVILS